MKQDRLIGIINTLQQKGRVTAPYLAEKFEVSGRTINRSGLLTEKMGGTLPETDYMTIDLASFYKDSLAEKIDLLKQTCGTMVHK